MKPAEFEDMFSVPWTRDAITEVVNKGIGHLKQVRFQIVVAVLPFILGVEPSSLGYTTGLGARGSRGCITSRQVSLPALHSPTSLMNI